MLQLHKGHRAAVSAALGALLFAGPAAAQNGTAATAAAPSLTTRAQRLELAAHAIGINTAYYEVSSLNHSNGISLLEHTFRPRFYEQGMPWHTDTSLGRAAVNATASVFWTAC